MMISSSVYDDKLRALHALVPYLPRALRVFVPYELSCSRTYVL